MSFSMNYYLQEKQLHARSPHSDSRHTYGGQNRIFNTISAASNGNSSSFSPLDALLSLDARLTGIVAVCAQPRTPLQKLLRLVCYLLELTGHGLTWFVVCGLLSVSYWYTRYHLFWIYLFNMFVILVADIVVVAPIKLYFQRPRPKLNLGKIPLSISSVDKYAFPSGHTSRSVALAVLFCYMSPFHMETNLFCAWACLVSLSRVLIGRHHILDVLVGIVAGFAIFEITKITILIL